MSPVAELMVTLSTFPSFTCWYSSENAGWDPCVLLPLNTAHTSTARQNMMTHRTTLRNLNSCLLPHTPKYWTPARAAATHHLAPFLPITAATGCPVPRSPDPAPQTRPPVRTAWPTQSAVPWKQSARNGASRRAHGHAGIVPGSCIAGRRRPDGSGHLLSTYAIPRALVRPAHLASG